MDTLRYRLTLSIMLLGLVVSLPIHARTLQSLAGIEHAAYEHGLSVAQAQYDSPQLVMTKLDRRLRLSACGGPLEAYSNGHDSGLGNQTIGIKCHHPVAWTVFVPIQVKVFKSVVVASQPLAAKHVITQADLQMRRHDISNMRQGYVQKIDLAIGQQLKYAIAMGAVIKQSNLTDKTIVVRGEQVIMVSSVGNMQVRMAGTAMSNASKGQRIRVKNTSSKRIVEGIVDAPGIVRVEARE